MTIRSIARWPARVFRPLTMMGRAVCALGAVAWLGAWQFGWAELSVLAGACVVAVVIALAFTVGRTDIELNTLLMPQRVLAGRPAVAAFTVRNRSTRRMLPVRLECPVGAGIAPIHVPMLNGGASIEDSVVIPTTRRSVLAIGPTRSVRSDPLGLCRLEVTWSDQQELFVHPITSPMAGLSSGWMRDLEGQTVNTVSMSDVAFHTLREYTPGDDRRHVHWRSTAKLGTLMVKQFVDNRRSQLGIVLSTHPADFRHPDEFELAISMAASLGLRAILDGQEVACVAGDRPVAAHTGQALLDGMARAELGVPSITIHQTVMASLHHTAAASVMLLVAGSALPREELQLASRRFTSDAVVLALRVAPGEEPAMGRLGHGWLMTAPDLDGFTRMMWSVSKS